MLVWRRNYCKCGKLNSILRLMLGFKGFEKYEVVVGLECFLLFLFLCEKFYVGRLIINIKII